MSPSKRTQEAGPPPFVEEVEVRGHIIDSLILPKILDCITSRGGKFSIRDIQIGQGQSDPSFAVVEVSADTDAVLQEILAQISDHGAIATAAQDCTTEAVTIDGAYPEGFYSTTNQRTEIRLAGEWVEVALQEMDCAIAVDPQTQAAQCVPMSDVSRGTEIVVGHAGVRVFPEDRPAQRQSFEFMNSSVSSEKPKGAAIRQVARQMAAAKAGGGKILIVGGPAIVHTGSGPHLIELIRMGYVDRLFAGNALAAHDIEQSMFGTSLGVYLEHGGQAEAGHEHHLRAINRIRALGGIRQAVAAKQLTSGVMFECVEHGVDFLLAGSIRDDGPLPDVITDAIEAQRQMRERVRDVSFCLMIATTLHSIAVGNLLPAWVDVVCVDINPSTVIKLSDRGSMQTIGVVTDVEPFLRALIQEVKALPS